MLINRLAAFGFLSLVGMSSIEAIDQRTSERVGVAVRTSEYSYNP